jgi:hypothetical protein
MSRLTMVLDEIPVKPALNSVHLAFTHSVSPLRKISTASGFTKVANDFPVA